MWGKVGVRGGRLRDLAISERMREHESSEGDGGGGGDCGARCFCFFSAGTGGDGGGEESMRGGAVWACGVAVLDRLVELEGRRQGRVSVIMSAKDTKSVSPLKRVCLMRVSVLNVLLYVLRSGLRAVQGTLAAAG